MKLISRIGILILLCVVIGCGVDESSSSTLGIIGDDDRALLTDSNYDRLIGQVLIANVPICTGFISSSFEFTTAAHCINLEFKDEYKIRLISGELFGVTGESFRNAASDVVRLKMDNYFEEWLEAGIYDSSQSASIIGHNSDTNLFFQSFANEFSTHGRSGLVIHEMDTKKGASGSPIIQNNKVVGVHIGASFKNNVGVLLSHLGSIEENQLHDLILTQEAGKLACDILAASCMAAVNKFGGMAGCIAVGRACREAIDWARKKDRARAKAKKKAKAKAAAKKKAKRAAAMRRAEENAERREREREREREIDDSIDPGHINHCRHGC
jgi:hypothetical protein